MAEPSPEKEIEGAYVVPEGWVWCTLEEVFFEIMNGTTEAQNVDGVGFPVTRIETIQKREFDMFRVKFIDSTSQEFLDKYKYRVGDIALSHINSKEHVGKTAIYLGHPETLIHGMNLLRLRFGHTNGFPQFFLLVLPIREI